MSWKDNPILLAQKLVERISADGETTFDKLEVRARQLGVNLNTFDRAIALVHKLKTVKRVTVLGTVRYSIQEVKKKPEPGDHARWCSQNYPWPGKNGVPEFVMPFPEIDFSWIFLKPEELKKYKAKSKGRSFIPRKRYQHANS